jgi:hypothetical protein
MAKLGMLFIFLLTGACASAPKNSANLLQEKKDEKSASESYKTLAISKYQVDIEYIFNDIKTLVVCARSQKLTNEKPQHSLKFFVYDVGNDKVLFEESLADGEVVWKNDHQILVTRRMGTAQKDGSNISTYVFDLMTQKKIPEDPNKKEE